MRESKAIEYILKKEIGSVKELIEKVGEENFNNFKIKNLIKLVTDHKNQRMWTLTQHTKYLYGDKKSFIKKIKELLGF